MATRSTNAKYAKKLSKIEAKRAARLRRQASPTTQNTLSFEDINESGLLEIQKNHYSKTWKLGDATYTTANEDTKADIIDSYASAINTLDEDNSYQLLVVNRRISSDIAEKATHDLQGDKNDEIRENYNSMIAKHFKHDLHNFKVEKYITLHAEANNVDLAKQKLREIGASFEGLFKEVDINFTDMDGSERLRVLGAFLGRSEFMNYDFHDIAISGLNAKAFIAPNRIQFFEDKIQIDNFFVRVMYIRQFPSFLNDRLIKSITDTGVELAVALHLKPYQMGDYVKELRGMDSDIKARMTKSVRKNSQRGLGGELAISGVDAENREAIAQILEEINENDQKMFSGVFLTLVKGDTEEELELNTDKVMSAVRKHGVEFEIPYLHQELALNSVLPIGKAFLDVERNYMRDMTTSNVATQIPFTNVDLQSESDRAVFYGVNQLSHNIITVDRKRDLNTGSGVILGSSGSGKSVTVKSLEIIPTLLKYPEDRTIIADPEDEYSDIGREFGAEIIEIYPGSTTHLNLLDLPDLDKLDAEDADPIGQKSNLLMGLFESILEEVTDSEFSIIDRVTREVYERFEKPTLKEWHQILKEQNETEAQNLAVKSEMYAIGSQDIFAHPTNVDMENKFIIFNLKKLNNKLKPFALLVIQDYIWNQVIAMQGKITSHIYFDEMQLLFNSDMQAQFFTELYSRIRKYGAIPTGITQNVETLLSRKEGRLLLSNSEFIILLKQKDTDLRALSEAITLTPSLVRFVSKPKAKGTGLIVAGNTIVPFENPIPKNTKLYKLIATDA